MTIPVATRPATVLSVYMTAFGIGTSDLAAAVGIGVPYMSSIRTGARKPSYELRKRIANTLGVPYFELFPPRKVNA